MAPQIRAYRPGDELGIIALYQLVFGLHLTLEEWHWYFGRDSIIVVAEAGGRIVGHYAVQPRPFLVRGQPFVAGLVVGSMVAPEFRNVTTFIDSANHAYELCRARDIPFVYAFPNNDVWLVRRRMLDWKALPPLVSLIARPDDLETDDEVANIELLAPKEAIAAEWLDAVDTTSIRAHHTSDFLGWRFHKPGVDYPVYVHREGGEVRGYVALKHYDANGRKEGHILAFRVAPGAEARSGRLLLARTKNHFRSAGTERISMWMLPASPLYPTVTGAGMRPEGGTGKNFGFLAFDDELSATLADGARWDIAMSDSDVY